MALGGWLGDRLDHDIFGRMVQADNRVVRAAADVGGKLIPHGYLRERSDNLKHEADTNIESPTKAPWKAFASILAWMAGSAAAGSGGEAGAAGAGADTTATAGASTTGASATADASVAGGADGFGSAAASTGGSTTGASSAGGLGQYATMANAQKLYAGVQLAKALSPAPAAAPVSAPPKAAQQPGLQNARGNLSGGSTGVASTFLTGTAGVDPSLLNLGRSTLLGG